MKALLPLSWLYGAGVWIRNQAFDSGIFRSVSVAVPVISVGNITTGGSGKTPLVEYIARYFMASGRRVGIVSRGYGRTSSGVVTVADGHTVLVGGDQGGDEPVELARKLPHAVVVVGERRVEAARVAIEDFHVEVILLDDGFQHRYIRRDMDIVVLRHPEITLSDDLLPAGRKREPNRALRRAHVMALNRAGDQQVALGLTDKYFRGTAIGLRYDIAGFDRVDGQESLPTSSARGRVVHAFSGIGDPDSFEADLTQLGLVVQRHTRFGDHHKFTDGELSRIMREASQRGVPMVVTTEKDLARLSSRQRAAIAGQPGLFAARLSVAVTFGEQEFREALERTAFREYLHQNNKRTSS